MDGQISMFELLEEPDEETLRFREAVGLMGGRTFRQRARELFEREWRPELRTRWMCEELAWSGGAREKVIWNCCHWGLVVHDGSDYDQKKTYTWRKVLEELVRQMDADEEPGAEKTRHWQY